MKLHFSPQRHREKREKPVAKKAKIDENAKVFLSSPSLG
jgi:hypothetical protein